MTNSKQVHVYTDRPKMAQGLMRDICQLAAQSASTRKQFRIALSGGTLIEIMANALDQNLLGDDFNWSTWQVFWADERWVSWDSPDSNYGTAHKRFLSRVPIPGDQIYAMDTALPLHKTARDYAATLESVFKPSHNHSPRFDLILLGIGSDGHTASLFPDHPVLSEKRAWVAPVMGAPKPPSNRITLTLPVLNQARHIAWVANGTDKADIVARILNASPGSHELPAGQVKPSIGDSSWFIDQDAAAGL